MTAPPRSFHGATFTLRTLPNRSLSDTISLGHALLSQGLRLIELRDDLLTDEALAHCKESFPAHHILLSLRRQRSDLSAFVTTWNPHFLDIALELGPLPPSLTSWLTQRPILRTIRSLHARQESEEVSSLLLALSDQTPPDQIIKAAIPIRTIRELVQGHTWQRSNPRRHVFLPIASDGSGRFRFYRLLLGESLLLNFLRDPCAPLIPDQPTLSEWQTRHHVPIPAQGPIPFAAIVGDPVEHSRTPAHHGSFFARYGMPVLKVRVTSLDLSSDVLSILLSLGLRACAITSPHKTWLRDSIDQHSGMWEVSDDRDPQSAGNTLVACDDGTVFGTSTDGIGLRAAWEETLIAQRERCGQNPGIAVFGGGGLLPLLRTVFPGALFLSARSGKPRSTGGRRSNPTTTPIGTRS